MSEVSSCVIDGVELVYSYRAGDGPCVVFISGLGESGAAWDAVIGLMPAGTATFTYARAGCGDSGALPAALVSEERSIVWGAEQLRKLLEAADVQGPWVPVGHSIGGLIADAFARRWPESVGGMVLVDASDAAFNDGLDEPEEVYVDGRDGEGWRISMPATLQNFEPGPERPVETVVIGSAIWRWLSLDDPSPYRPLTLPEIDQRWHRHQLALAERWSGHLVVPHTAGHSVHREAPELVATTTHAVVVAAAAETPVELDQEALIKSGGAVRVSVKDGALTVWDSTGERGTARDV
ncbi:alpha/beta fold hydrolase [Kribbella antibiotica]|uniref:alpha/beta fold hydrolase n=1 Tax=Kribbella antibiotica TaxID=190195 RepID=UPI0014050FFD|nr:alpha/beta hydrolase [Kribbella antibiotica]